MFQGSGALVARTMIALMFAICWALPGRAQIAVSANKTAAVLSAMLAGPGITISNPALKCPLAANGTFTVSPSTPLGTGGAVFGIGTGILLTTGKAINVSGPESFLASTNNSATGDPTLVTLAGATTYDACILEFDVTPTGDTIKFNYQFGSEEYNHSTCGPYNDAFAFFISGPGISGSQNMALIPASTIPVTVNSVNSGIPGSGYTTANCTAMGAGSPYTSLFDDNTGGPDLTYQGFTKKMTALSAVTPCNTYHLRLMIADAGNSVYDSGVFIEAGSLTTPVITGAATVCIGGTTALSFSVPGGTWSSNNTAVATVDNTTGVVSGISAGVATITHTVGAGCISTVSVTVNAIPAITGGNVVCIGNNITLSNAAAGGSWSISDAATATIDAATGVVTGIAVGSATITYTFGSGCISVSPLSVNNGITGGMITATDTVICQGTGATFTASYPGIALLDSGITWSVGGSSFANVNPLFYSFPAAGVIPVSFTFHTTGCPDAVTTRNVEVYPAPAVNLGPDTFICAGSDALRLTDYRSTGHEAVSWLWNTGQTTSSIYINSPGTYFVTVTVNGCWSSDTVEVRNDCYVDIPNAFSPNNDGINDYFFPRAYLSHGLTRFSMNIYNRWGELIFQSASLDGRGWDGSFNGVPQPEGVYVYVIDAYFRDGQKEHHQGNVTLLK